MARCVQGEVKKVGEHRYEVYGRAEKINNTTIQITELPIYKWTQNFKADLEALCVGGGDKEKSDGGVLKVDWLTLLLSLSTHHICLGLQGTLHCHQCVIYAYHVREGGRKGRGPGFDRLFQAYNENQHEQHDMFRLRGQDQEVC